MPNDIVARLRSYAYLDDTVYNQWVYREAADRIEKLEAALREFFTSGDFDIVTTGNEEATQAWIERAHAALAGRPADD
jgi:hypothetical protein